MTERAQNTPDPTSSKSSKLVRKITSKLPDKISDKFSGLTSGLEVMGANDGPSYGAAGPRAFYTGLFLVGLSLFAGVITFLILTGLTPIVPKNNVVIAVLFIDLLLIAAMIAVITWQVKGIILARRQEQAGSRLHVRLLGLFAIIALLPALTLAFFATIALDRGLDQLFSSKTKAIISNSLEVAQSYIDEHGQVIRNEVVAMARDVSDQMQDSGTATGAFKTFAAGLTNQARLRQLPIAHIVDERGRRLVSALTTKPVKYEPPNARAFASAQKGEAVVFLRSRSSFVGAVKKLPGRANAFLYVARPMNPIVLRQYREAQASTLEYTKLEERRLGTQVAFALMYLVLALTFVLSAVWAGISFANRLVTPLRRVMGAAEAVSAGNLDVTVPEEQGEGDLKLLARQFNVMTKQLGNQRNELIETNAQLDERRRFTEAVLFGVSAGVIGLDESGKIEITNPSACALLGQHRDQLIGRMFTLIEPAFEPLLEKIAADPRSTRLQDQINFTIDGEERNFAVQVTREAAGAGDRGYVVTFDDISELVSAQRTSAWADVARRIAHEIKNPLTPIQLSAERLRRKYGKNITEDPEVFERCTETIIRQVGDIGRMVDEFSSFARMPKPEMAVVDIRNLVREAVFLFEVGNSKIKLSSDVPDTPVVVLCDARLLAQALTNLVKNATEGVGARIDAEGDDYQGFVKAKLTLEDDGQAQITVLDNGVGLPKKNRQRLTEPYMTTREKGTGLGLAIVVKIIEQHGGKLFLEDADHANDNGIAGASGGAQMRFVLPLHDVSQDVQTHEGQGRGAESASQSAEGGPDAAGNQTTKATTSDVSSPTTQPAHEENKSEPAAKKAAG